MTLPALLAGARLWPLVTLAVCLLDAAAWVAVAWIAVAWWLP